MRLVRLASLLPNWAIKLLWRRFPPDPETCEGFWFDASYWKYCRVEKRCKVCHGEGYVWDHAGERPCGCGQGVG